MLGLAGGGSQCGVMQYLAQHMMSFATLVALDMPETTLTAVLQTEGFERQVNKPFKHSSEKCLNHRAMSLFCQTRSLSYESYGQNANPQAAEGSL